MITYIIKILLIINLIKENSPIKHFIFNISYLTVNIYKKKKNSLAKYCIFILI